MNRHDWAVTFLTYCGLPVTPDNVAGMIAWAASEGSLAAFNPLATERQAPNTTDFNSVGVKNYPTLEVGLLATKETLYNGLYQPIIDILTEGQHASQLVDAISASPWGSHPTQVLLASVLAQPQQYGDVLIGGTVTDTPTQTHLAAPVVGGCARPQNDGYWLVGADGGVFPFGAAADHGNATTLALARPIVGMFCTSSGEGYWLVAADGGVFAYGDAPSLGSVPGLNIGPA